MSDTVRMRALAGQASDALVTLGKTAIAVTSLFIEIGCTFATGFVVGLQPISQRACDIIAKIDRGAYRTQRRRQKALRRMRRAMGDRS